MGKHGHADDEDGLQRRHGGGFVSSCFCAVVESLRRAITYASSLVVSRALSLGPKNKNRKRWHKKVSCMHPAAKPEQNQTKLDLGWKGLRP